ncbi:unnamed protein product [Caenorhabditis bovis]|uniref:Cadherin domain-containing protein n=1 Tax=Caenorhabditis bovis TaxID=2654633 RepID=A0A8S1EXG7_9PELO|nr:unnamed protein product [Caenorhabditis bovis]
MAETIQYVIKNWEAIGNSFLHEFKDQHFLLAALKGLRNGLVYGVRIRAPHALVMVFLFGEGTLAQKLQTIFRLTRMHATNLAKFVFSYKLLEGTLGKIEGVRREWHSFAAAFLVGYLVFGENNAVNMQINLYLLSRVVVGLVKLAANREVIPQPKFAVFPWFAAAVWGVVLWLFEYHPTVLQGSLQKNVAALIVEPQFLLVEEDWPIGDALPLALCPKNVKVIAGDPNRFFSVSTLNETCSTLRLNQHLDADKENSDGIRGQSFSLVVAGPQKSRATLEIQVVDVNDNPPVFVETPTSFDVAESVDVGTELFKIRTKDADTGISGISRFAIDSDFFKLTRRKCANGMCTTTLKTAKLLDFEEKPVHMITITAKDGDPHSNRSHTVAHTVTINLINEHDGAPIFETDLSKPLKIAANAKIGEILAKIRAKCGEHDENEKVSILYEVATNDFVTMNAETGEIRLEKIPANELSLEITAYEQANPTRSVKGKLRIVVEQKADAQIQSKPDAELCEFPIYEAKIVEGKGEFLEPIFIKLLKENANVRLIGGSDMFQLDQPTSERIELKIVDSGKVGAQNLDNAQLLLKSDVGQCRIVLRSISADLPLRQSPTKSAKFDKEVYEFELSENQQAQKVGQVRLIGGGGSSSSAYRLQGSELFNISESGEIFATGPIDREATARFELTVTSGEAAATSRVSIRILDENDNSPVFERDVYTITVDEGKSEKIKIVATDRDDGPNAHITYSIEENLDNLPIDISDGILFIGAIDRDALDAPDVNLTIRATDAGIPPRSAYAKVHIRVKDINDNSPVFSNSKYSIVLDANISPGGIVGSVSADDADATSPNNYIRYSSANPSFRITDKGEIIFVGDGILSQRAQLSFNVTATDGGQPALSSTALVVLNEHIGGLQNELTTQINSNDTQRRSEIKWLNAGMPGYTYEIIRATADGFDDEAVKKWISIDAKTGIIETLTRIDPDLVKQVKLYISMRKGKREVPVELIIKVVDTDDVVPIYKNSTMTRTTSISESATIGTTVLSMPAEGVTPDDGVEYMLNITSGPRYKLGIDRFGTIKLVRQLDYEREKVIRGFVRATIDGNEAVAPIEIRIFDANDNRPIFKNNSIFVTSIEESAVLGTILDLPYPLATDKDSGKFAQLRYSMTGDEGFFRIDEGNSTIRLVSRLDFETQRVHSLSIKCVDNNGEVPFHEIFASVTVHVVDVNDNSPIIHNSDLSHLSVGEDAQPGTVITVIIASDADEGGKQAMRMSANSTMFRIDDSRRLIVDAPLNGHAGQRLCSTITVGDVGVPTRESTAPYCVTVYPAKNNHHNPLVISPKPNSIHYFDENIVYDELLKVEVLDEGGENVTFGLDETFKKDWQLFKIDRTSGSLTARQPFDFEKKTVHEIKILACRSTNCTSTHLFISVNDRNDNCPMFPKQDVRLTVVENEKGHRQIGRIPAALDSDFHSDNTKVCYATDSPLFFFADAALPVLYTNSSFDREQRKQHQIVITAFDCHSACRDPHKPANGTIVALIDVIDVNDNFPRFAERVYQTTVVQGQVSSGSHILTLTATDADEEVDGLKYSIRGFVRSASHAFSPQDSPISIDGESGEITANEMLKDSSYSFAVVVVDGAGHEDTTSVIISVVTYAQQTELVFDAPFELIIKNEKKIENNLSNATGLKAIVDKCRQNSNFTLMLVHFTDQDGQFVNVDRAVNLLMSSTEESRRELRSVYGLREAFSPVPIPSKMPQIIVISVLVFFLVFLLSMCIWCRQRNNYERKLRHISAQASTVHTVTLGRPGSTIKPNPGYGEIQIGAHQSRQCAASHAQAPPRPLAINLQSTEL